MSGAVKKVKKTVKKVFKPVKKVAKKAVKEVKSAGRSIDEEVFQPVKDGAVDAAQTVGDGFQAIGKAFKKPDIKIPETPEEEPGAGDPLNIEEEPPAPELGGKGSEGGRKARRKGRKSLRIDLRTGNAGAGGNGLNVPRS